MCAGVSRGCGGRRRAGSEAGGQSGDQEAAGFVAVDGAAAVTVEPGTLVSLARLRDRMVMRGRTPRADAGRL